MSDELFRFVHAADFHLGQPLYGLADAPEHLRKLLVDAPYAAAGRVFETAVLEEADCLILSGDLVDPRSAGPFAIAFLLEQFDVLRQHGVAAYWVGGGADRRDRWPRGVPLPQNVHVFKGQGVEVVTLRPERRPLATICGRTWDGSKRIRPADFQGVGGEHFTVVATYGRGGAELLGQQQIDYWALGGRHQPAWFEAAPRTAHYPGTPQGRCPNETGAHGCTMVSVGLDRRVHIQSVPTDSVRWQTEPVTLEDGASGEDLRRRLSDRAEEIAAEGAGCCVLVSWIVSGGARMGAQLQHRGLADEIILELRQEFGRRSPAVWTVSLVGQPPESWPSQQRDEDTILGDFLRAVRQCETNDDELPDLTPYLPQHDPAGLLASAAQIRDARARASVLRQAAMLGADLLRGDDEGVPR